MSKFTVESFCRFRIGKRSLLCVGEISQMDIFTVNRYMRAITIVSKFCYSAISTSVVRSLLLVARVPRGIGKTQVADAIIGGVPVAMINKETAGIKPVMQNPDDAMRLHITNADAHGDVSGLGSMTSGDFFIAGNQIRRPTRLRLPIKKPRLFVVSEKLKQIGFGGKWFGPGHSLRPIIPVLLLSIILSGCASIQPASTSGECRLFHDPGFAVQGKRIQDKRWIGATQETAIEVCGWKRPTK